MWCFAPAFSQDSGIQVAMATLSYRYPFKFALNSPVKYVSSMAPCRSAVQMSTGKIARWSPRDWTKIVLATRKMMFWSSALLPHKNINSWIRIVIFIRIPILCQLSTWSGAPILGCLIRKKLLYLPMNLVSNSNSVLVRNLPKPNSNPKLVSKCFRYMEV